MIRLHGTKSKTVSCPGSLLRDRIAGAMEAIVGSIAVALHCHCSAIKADLVNADMFNAKRIDRNIWVVPQVRHGRQNTYPGWPIGVRRTVEYLQLGI